MIRLPHLTMRTPYIQLTSDCGHSNFRLPHLRHKKQEARHYREGMEVDMWHGLPQRDAVLGKPISSIRQHASSVKEEVGT